MCQGVMDSHDYQEQMRQDEVINLTLILLLCDSSSGSWRDLCMVHAMDQRAMDRHDQGQVHQDEGIN